MGFLECLRRERLRRSFLTAVVMLLPNFLGFLVFTAGPVLFSLAMSFTDWNLARHAAGNVPVRVVGLGNFEKLLWFSRNEFGPPVEHPVRLAMGFGAVLVAFVVLLGVAWHLRARRPRESNPAGRFFVLWGAACATLISLGTTAVTGAWTAHPRLAWGWPVAKLLVAALCVWGCARHLLREHAGAERRRIAGLCLAILGCLACVRLDVALGHRVFAVWEPRTPAFWSYLYNTIFLMLGIPVSIAGSLAMALVLFRTVEVAGWRRRARISAAVAAAGLVGTWAVWMWVPGRSPEQLALLLGTTAIAAIGIAGGTTAFRTLFYLPSVGMGVATYILWQKMLNPDTGPLNAFLSTLFGLPPFAWLEAAVHWWNPALADWRLAPPEWLQSVTWAKPALMLMGVWGAVGSNNMLLYLAGLSNIPTELYEAADMDGANRWQRFWNVTWPQLAPTTFFIVVMSCIGGLQGGFEQARIMTNGGPARSTTTISYYLYIEAFELNNMGFGCAIAWTLFVMVFALTLVNWRFGNRIVAEYQ